MKQLTPEQKKRVQANIKRIGIPAIGARTAVANVARRAIANPRASELLRHSNSLYKTAIARGSKVAKKGLMKASQTAKKLANKYK